MPVGQPSTQERRKVPQVLIGGEAPKDLTEHFDIWVPIDESVLGNPRLAKQLLEAALLPTNRENRKDRTIPDIFSSFYPIILSVSRYFFVCSLLLVFSCNSNCCLFQLVHDVSAIETRFQGLTELGRMWVD